MNYTTRMDQIIEILKSLLVREKEIEVNPYSKIVFMFFLVEDNQKFHL